MSLLIRLDRQTDRKIGKQAKGNIFLLLVKMQTGVAIEKNQVWKILKKLNLGQMTHPEDGMHIHPEDQTFCSLISCAHYSIYNR